MKAKVSDGVGDGAGGFFRENGVFFRKYVFCPGAAQRGTREIMIFRMVTGFLSLGTNFAVLSSKSGSVTKTGRNTMTVRQAVRILMLSPIYFRLDLPSRRLLVDEFRAVYAGKPILSVERRFNR